MDEMVLVIALLVLLTIGYFVCMIFWPEYVGISRPPKDFDPKDDDSSKDVDQKDHKK